MAAIVGTATRSALSCSRTCIRFIPCTAAISHKCYSNKCQNRESYDVIVVGGGLTGTTLACTLAQNLYLQNKKILLLEGCKNVDFIPDDTKYSNRVVALNQRSYDLLSSIGAWKHIEAVRYGTVQEMQVWDACSDAEISFDTGGNKSALAYIVENDLIVHAVKTELQKVDNVDVIYQAKVKDVNLSKERIEAAEVTLADGQTYRAQLVIGADGTNSLVRKAMAAGEVKHNYEEMGIVATLKLAEPVENVIAWQRFLPTGPIAILPLTDSLSSLVWTTGKKEAKRLLEVSEEEFVDNVNRAIWEVHPKSNLVELSNRVTNFINKLCDTPNTGLKQLPPSISGIEEGSRAAFPLGLSIATSCCATGAVLVGDAIHRVHPMAGQGANLGFGDVATLVEKLANSAKYGFHLGDLGNLMSYERDRLINTIPITLGIHVLHNIYGTTWAPVVAARNIGIQFTNACSPLKDFLARRAYGEDLYKDRT